MYENIFTRGQVTYLKSRKCLNWDSEDIAKAVTLRAVSYTHLDVYKRQNLAVRPLPELEIEQEHHAQQNSSPDIRIQFMTWS